MDLGGRTEMLFFMVATEVGIALIGGGEAE